MKPPSIYIVFQRATFRSGLENQHFRILADLAASPINTVLLGHAHFWKNVPKSWKSIENEPILKFPGWDSGVLNPRTIIRLIRPLPSPKSGLKNQKSSKIQNIQNPKVYTKFVRQPYVPHQLPVQDFGVTNRLHQFGAPDVALTSGGKGQCCNKGRKTMIII